MDRRGFLSMLGGAIVIGATSPVDAVQMALRRDKPIYSGWLPDNEPVRQWVKQQDRPYFAQAAPHLKNTGRGKRVLLWPFFENVSGGELVPHNQGIGDCCSQGMGLGIDILTGVQIKYHFKPQQWIAKAATEVIYAGSRVEIGGGRIRGDGSYGIWTADWVRKYGVLLRHPYFGKYDFTRYNPDLARRWSHKCTKRTPCTLWGGGVPIELELAARRHPIRTTKLVKTWPQARDAVANGYPVVICSRLGYTDERDNDGFAEQRGTWYHCLLLAGIDTLFERHGGLFINSWGPNWNGGPKRLGQPDGSFWADAENIHEMLRQGDSFAISNYNGYPRRNLDYRLY